MLMVSGGSLKFTIVFAIHSLNPYSCLYLLLSLYFSIPLSQKAHEKLNKLQAPAWGSNPEEVLAIGFPWNNGEDSWGQFYQPGKRVKWLVADSLPGRWRWLVSGRAQAESVAPGRWSYKIIWWDLSGLGTFWKWLSSGAVLEFSKSIQVWLPKKGGDPWENSKKWRTVRNTIS